MTRASVVWLRDDLRLADNPALNAALERDAPVVVLFIDDEVSPGIRPLGGAARWYRDRSLAALDARLREHGSELLMREGPAEKVLPDVVAETDAEAVFWNRRYGAAREIDARLKTSLRASGLVVDSFQANLLFEPWTVTTGDGGPFKVFTPFWNAAKQLPVRDPRTVEMPRSLGSSKGANAVTRSDPSTGSGPEKPWQRKLASHRTPGEEGAHELLDSFVTDRLADYHRRDEPGVEATSMLSAGLRFGELSPFQVWERVHGDMTAAARKNVPKFLSEVAWREFNWSILFNNPKLATDNYRPAFDAFPWAEPDPAELDAWKIGRTGIPLVDAGMRELWETGYMHNRVRMVVASFLIKNLLIDWRIGEQWFWDTLLDADEANNPGNWQWVAGSGADAAPYFRVFNPELQAAKFDPRRKYIGKWVPELDTPDYPAPIVDLAQSRKDALAAYEHVKSGSR